MRRAWFCGLALTAAAGCAAYDLPPDPLELPAPQSPYAKPAAADASAPTTGAAPTSEPSHMAFGGSTQASAAAAPGTNVDPTALRKVMNELNALGDVDHATQQQLLADLEQTDPALWPVLMQTFRAGLAYRQRQAGSKGVTAATFAAEVATASVPSASVPAEAIATDEQTSSASATSNVAQALLPQLDALQGTTRTGGAGVPGLAMPTQMLLSAALAEAQRQSDARGSREAQGPNAGPTATSPAKAAAAIENPVRIVAAPTSEPEALDDDSGDDEPPPKPAPGYWRTSLEATIAQLEPLTRQPPTSAAEVTRHAWLHVLYLAAGRREEALRPIPGIAAAEQDFWSEQLFALSTYLDAEKLTDPAARSAEARRHLAKAETRLAEAGNLAIRNLAFCTEVSSFGVYEKFKETEFKPGRPLILYAEIDNFKSEETEKGFHTALRSSYQILDAQGRRVAENDLALTEEYCRNRRRDYFIRYFLSVPERIYAGKYVLQLTIVDTLSGKIGQATIDFAVGEEAK